jgi:hypothetical protein
MIIRFLHMPLDRIDQLCKEHENELIMISVECYKQVQVTHDNGIVKTEEWLTSSFGYGIRSSKDVFQFNNEDMKILSEDIKQKLR